MIEAFKHYLDNTLKINKTDTILLAVSAGVDSVVMANLFYQSNISCGIAHCNFQLRGEESDQDELFVQQLAAHYGFPYYKILFDTRTYAREHDISIQMAARELRYDWFEHIRSENNYDYIAIGHNSDDVAETFFINITRGTGIRGISGIKPVERHIIRPVLFASREQVLNHCQQNNIQYREDSSNSSVQYVRNKIRHQIIPLFEELNPGFKSTMKENIRHFADVEEVFLSSVNKIKKELVTFQQGNATISIPRLRQLSPIQLYAFELLKDFGFTRDHVNILLEILNHQPGKQLFSNTHRLVKDRDELIITPRNENNTDHVYVNEGIHSIDEPVPLTFKSFSYSVNHKIPQNEKIAWIDQEKLIYPLIIRRWKHGDYFVPLGMQHHKKLSDYMTDSKFSLADKEKTFLLCSGNEIVWIIGHRIDDRFKITDNTNIVLEIKIKLF
ncbi:MAG: tRNA lysidine(34) synthetase TilS [Bacteroidota bacterium]